MCLMIDSEQVAWGKGEKQAGEAVEIEPETIRLQGSEAHSVRSTQFIKFIKLKVHKVRKVFYFINFITLKTFNSW